MPSPDAAHSDSAIPFALVENGSHGLTLAALDDRARREGLYPGQALADARAAVPRLLTRPAERARDRAALKALALWCGRYGPHRNCHGPHDDDEENRVLDSLWIDVTGVAHLFGGEARLLADLAARLARFGLTAHIGLADTFGAAFAAARFATAEGTRTSPRSSVPPSSVPPSIIPPHNAKTALSALPVDALLLPTECVLLLKRLGLRRIGQLYDLPREAMAQRFRTSIKPPARSTTTAGKREREMIRLAGAVLARLDQALGAAAEILLPIEEPPALIVRQTFVEPLISTEGVAASTAMLATELCRRLDAGGQGGSRFTLHLYRSDATSATITIGLSRPCREAPHLIALLAEKLAAIDAGFGIDGMTLAAIEIEALDPRQTTLPAPGIGTISTDPSPLIDRLSNRLGATRVLRLVAADSHCPERAEQRRPALTAPTSAPVARNTSSARRPPFLLAAPEPIVVTAEVPEGPPLRFTWRRLARRVLRAQGPERIEPEWWRTVVPDNLSQQRSPLARSYADRPRDYYVIEARGGGRYWIFRAGLYGSDSDAAPPGWFLHGVFG